MPPKLAPMITPTARSTTLPRMMNVLNSLSMVLASKGAASESADTLQRAAGEAREGRGLPDQETELWA